MKMNIDLKDNSLVPEGFKKSCDDIQTLVKENRCSLIDLMGRTEEDEQTSLQIFKWNAKGELYTGNLIGLFEYRTKDGTMEQVVIGDRFGPAKVANDGAEGEFLSLFPWTMLESCGYAAPLMPNESRINGTADVFDQILVGRLAHQLARAWKKGQLRFYRSFSYYDCRVRGQLDLPRKIRLSMGMDDGKMAYRVREYSVDNPYDQLFFQACLAAEKGYPKLMRSLERGMPGFRMARQALEQQNAGWARGDTRSLLNSTKKRITNPIYRDYEKLRKIARAVLRRASHRSSPYAENGEAFLTGIFLDVSRLWEDYLYKEVFQGLSALRPKKIAVLEGMLIIRPDFLWEKGKLVLDAKYRPVWSRVWKTPLSEERKDDKGIDRDGENIRDDVYQVLTYMLTLDCTRGGVIFPIKMENTADENPPKNKGTDIPRHNYQANNEDPGQDFWLIPFAVPQVEDYEAFCDAMKAEVKEVRGKVKDFLTKDPG